MTKRVAIILSVLGVLTVPVMVYYYWDKISNLLENPIVFWNLFVEASHLDDVLSIGTIVTIGLFFLAAMIDVLALGWERSGLRKLVKGGNTSVWNDIWCYLLSVVRVFDILSLVGSLGVCYFLASVFLKFFQFSISDYIQNDWLKLIIVFILLDLVHYLQHKFMHFKPFWELHAYHHSAEEFTLLTTSRGHILEGAIYLLFSGMFYALVGGEGLLEIVFYLNAIREGYQYLLHSDVNWRLGFIGRYVLISPAAHRLHYSIKQEDYNKNYGTFFIWWDKLFGTYASPSEFYQIGITDNPYNKINFFKGQIVGIRRFLGWNSEK